MTATATNPEQTSPADAVNTESPQSFVASAIEIGKALVKLISEQQLTRQAAATAYNFLFSFVPLVIFIMSVAATISRQVAGTEDTVRTIMDWLFDNLPRTTAQAVQQPLEDAVSSSGGGLISFGAVAALFGARGAMGSLIAGLNASFEVDEARPFLRKQLVALALTIAVGLGIILAVVLFVLGEQIGDALAGPLGLGEQWATVWSYARWPLILVLLVLALAVLYWAGPNVKLPFKWLTPGALFAVPAWAIVTLGLSTYFQYFGSYAVSYGVLGGVLAFIFYLYVMCLVLLIGGALNAVMARRSHTPIVPKAEKSAKDRTDVDPSAVKISEEQRNSIPGRMRASVARMTQRLPWRSGDASIGKEPVEPAPPSPEKRKRMALGTLVLSAVAAVLGLIGGRRD